MATVKRTIYYYQIAPESVHILGDKLQALRVLPTAERAYRHKGQQVLFDTSEDLGKVRGFITLLRQSGIPAVGRLNSHDVHELELEEYEGLSEGSHFVLIPETGLIGFEYNHYGPRAPLLFEAVDKLYKEKIDDAAPPMEWSNLQGSQGFNAVNSAQGIKVIELAVARAYLRSTDIANETLRQALGAAAKLGEIGRVELVLKGDRNHRNILMSAREMLSIFIPNRAKELEAYEKFKVRLINESGGTEVVDLLNDRVRNFAVVQTTGRSRNVPRDALLDQMSIMIDQVTHDYHF